MKRSFICMIFLFFTIQSLAFADFKELYKQKKYQEALSEIKPLAESGNAEAQCHLGACYQFGIGINKNVTEAVKWYRLSAEKGFAEAQNSLGYLYYAGSGIPTNYKKALYWYQKAANQGYADAQANIGTMYFFGHGVEQDYFKAIKFSLQAAENGSMGGQYNLGYMYENGIGVGRDTTEAARWYQKSADQGYSLGQYRLGLMYEKGDGVENNIDKALDLYNQAAQQGEPNAKIKIENISTKINDEGQEIILIYCHHYDSIPDRKLFFVTTPASNYGFIYDSTSGSPLLDAVPDKVGSTRPIPGNEVSRSIVITQRTVTKHLKANNLEGGIPGFFVYVIIGGVIGFYSAPLLRKNPIISAIIGLFIGFLFAIIVIDGYFKVTRNDFCLFVDNSLSEDVNFQLDEHKPIKIPAISQLRIRFEEGIRHIKVTTASTNNVIEEFSLKAYKYRDASDKAVNGYYIYNIKANNYYGVRETVYKYER